MDTDTKTNTNTLTIPAAEFAAAVKVVAASAGTDKTLPMLTVIKVAGGGDTPIELVATDRFRLTVATIKGLRVGAGGEITPLLIPAAPLAKFMSGIKLPKFTREWDTIELFPAGDEVMVKATIGGEVSSITLRLSDATYPDYTKLGFDPSSERYTSGGTNLISVNPKLLGEISTVFSKVIKGSPLKLHLPNDDKRPILFTLDTEGVSYLTALMPMRTI